MELGATVSCMGYGYEVRVLINGTDIGVQGGKSESKRLFGAESELKKDAPADMRDRLFVLKPGENSLSVQCKKTGQEQDRLTFEMYVGEQVEPFISFVTSDASATFEKTFAL